MRVKIHPHRSKILNGVEASVSVTPTARGGKVFYSGTVELAHAHFVIHESGVQRARREQVRNVHAWCVGELVAAEPKQLALSEQELNGFTKVTYHYNSGRFMSLEAQPQDVTEEKFDRAFLVGRDFYVQRSTR